MIRHKHALVLYMSVAGIKLIDLYKFYNQIDSL